MFRRSLARLWLVASVAALATFTWATIPSQADAGTAPAVTVIYRGVSIESTLASRHFCHTRDYPVVRCFDSQADVDADLGWVEPAAPTSAASRPIDGGAIDGAVQPMATGAAYAIAYWDINYAGTSLTFYNPVPTLADLGWNDQISSVKSLNCSEPRFYEDANYTGSYWQDGCNEWTPNLGTFNDRISSVVNGVP